MPTPDLFDLMTLSPAAAAELGWTGGPLPPKAAVRRAVHAAFADPSVQGVAREQLGVWVQQHRAWLLEADQARRSEMLQVRCSPDELAQIRRAAHRAGCTVAQWVRQRAVTG